MATDDDTVLHGVAAHGAQHAAGTPRRDWLEVRCDVEIPLWNLSPVEPKHSYS